jgi:hypothetical protein
MSSNTNLELAAISEWIDTSVSYRGIDEEAHLVRRCAKAGEEFGEMLRALYGSLGENPRKGVTHTRAHLEKELLDIAVAALGAVEHLYGNTGVAMAFLNAHIHSTATRAVPYGLVMPENQARSSK